MANCGPFPFYDKKLERVFFYQKQCVTVSLKDSRHGNNMNED